MGSVAAGAFKVGLRGVQTPVARLDPHEIEEWTRQAAAPSRHEVLVGSRIGRQKQGRRDGHRTPRLFKTPSRLTIRPSAASDKLCHPFHWARRGPRLAKLPDPFSFLRN